MSEHHDLGRAPVGGTFISDGPALFALARYMSIDGDTVIWRSAKASGRGVLRGNVADSFLKRQQ